MKPSLIASALASVCLLGACQHQKSGPPVPGPDPLTKPSPPNTSPQDPSGQETPPAQGGGNLPAGETFEGHATYFDGFGFPSGGCGVPQARLESPFFVALNVQHSPNEYGIFLTRPIAEASQKGAWDNGRNCGRWVQVTLGKTCVGGVNSGEPSTDFCEGGTYADDDASGATLNMIVGDSCQDGNKWCRDDRYHLDLATASLTHFQKSGVATRNLQIGWKNPLIAWKFIDAPAYSGDIKIGFVQNAKLIWPTIVVTHLPRGIHKLEYALATGWKAARMNGDQGQAFVLEEAKPPYRIRVYDADDQLLAGGRIYQFDFPCSGSCPDDYTPVSYTTLSP